MANTTITGRKRGSKSKRAPTRKGSGNKKGKTRALIKKAGSKRGQTKKVARRTNRAEPSSIIQRDRQEASFAETGEIEDTGAVKEARSSVEDVVEDAKKTVEETTEPIS